MFILFEIMLITATITSFLIPSLLGKYIDEFTKGNLLIKELITSFVVVIIINIISLNIQKYLRNTYSNRVTLDIIKDLTEHILKLPMKFFKEQDMVYLSSRINMDSNNLADFLFKVISDLFMNIIILCVVVAYIFNIDISIGIKLFMLFPLYIILYKIFEKYLNKYSLEYKEKVNEAFGVMGNQFLNIKETKINNFYKAYKEKLMEYTDKAQRAIEKYLVSTVLFESIDGIIKNITLLLLIIYSGNLAVKGALTAGEFTVIIAYFNLAFEALAIIIEFLENYQNAKTSYERVLEIFETPKEIVGEHILNSIDSISLKDVSISYNEEKTLFKNLNYDFKKGNIYCISGENGRGKSSLLYSILGILEECSGEITYNNKNLTELNLYHIRTKLISYVAQEPSLVYGTLLENLTLGTDEYDRKTLLKYCNMFSLNNITKGDFLEVISGNNLTLSGGEIQKISICRALSKGAELLILDEPTSALDLKSKETLKNILLKEKKDKIIIYITHEEDFKRIADFILEL